LQCVAVCCSVLQCVRRVCFLFFGAERVLQLVCCSMLQCVAVCCSVLQCLAVSAAFSSALKYDTCIKRDLYTSKETYRQRLRTKNYGLSGHICALSSAQRYDAGVKRDVYTSKETYIQQKRPIHIKRDPSKRPRHSFPFYVYQKRPIFMKRDLYTSKETPQRDQYIGSPFLRR